MAWLGLAALGGAGLAVAVLRRWFVTVTVEGSSMAPTLVPGDRVLVRRTAGDRLRRGQVVVLSTPDRRRWLIKRVAAVAGDPVPSLGVPTLPGRVVPPAHLVVLGEGAGPSLDSRQLGFIPVDRVLGAVCRRLAG